MSGEEKSPAGDGEAVEERTADNEKNTTPPGSPQEANGDGELSSILDEIVAALLRHLSLPEGAAEAMAKWLLSAHALESGDFAPRLAIELAAITIGLKSDINPMTRRAVCEARDHARPVEMRSQQHWPTRNRELADRCARPQLQLQEPAT